ncbi:MAG: leucyl aminopeptidase family protein [Pseudomonadota bacterium]
MTLPIIVDTERFSQAANLFLIGSADEVPSAAREAAKLQQFQGELDQLCYVDGGILVGAGDGSDPLALGTAAMRLPEGDYRIEALPSGYTLENAVLGFALGTYRFSRYRKSSTPPVLLIDDADLAERVNSKAHAVFLTRDLVNTPADDMGPDALEAAARDVAERAGASFSVITGEALKEGFPLIHAVGRAAAIPPRLMDFRWSGGDRHSLTLVGKGVCFDSGGLNLKPGKGMALMKKDMGGAATTLGLAQLIMESGLPINLRVLIPAVENAVSGSAFRPGDVFKSREGQTVEISNTDGEGRLILADAIAYAAEESPDRILSLATLTGAARVALGPDLPPIYSTDEAFQKRICEAGMDIGDPLWPMPFWDRYSDYLCSDIADMNNVPSTPFAGSIIAAVFLKRFAGPLNFTHIDTYAWMPSARPGRPKGGEALTLRALYRALADEFSTDWQ